MNVSDILTILMKSKEKGVIDAIRAKRADVRYQIRILQSNRDFLVRTIQSIAEFSPTDKDKVEFSLSDAAPCLHIYVHASQQPTFAKLFNEVRRLENELAEQRLNLRILGKDK